MLLNLMMPEGDGFSVVEAMQTRPEWRSIPVVIVTVLDLSQADLDRLSGSIFKVLQKGSTALRTFWNSFVNACEVE